MKRNFGVGSRRRRRLREVPSSGAALPIINCFEDSRPLSSGFSLLEIILALAILAGSLAALGEVMRLADQNAALTRDESEAQILAASVMDELISGARQLMAVTRTPFMYDTEPQWLYSIAIEQTGYEQLVAVRILVEQDVDPKLQPARFELVRWLPNPDYVPPETASSTSSTSSTSSSTSAGGAASGGSSGGATR
jgi:prepilin-type N-terminal cleavage/methylation domain-containing protein